MSSGADLDELEPRLVWRHFFGLTRIPARRRRKPRCATTSSPGRRSGASQRPSTAPATSSCGCRPRPAASVRPRSSSRHTWTWSASGIRTARTTSARGASTSSATTTGCSPRDDARRRQRHRVAGAMAVAEDPEVAHGPLELLFTVSEEQGLVVRRHSTHRSCPAGSCSTSTAESAESGSGLPRSDTAGARVGRAPGGAAEKVCRMCASPPVCRVG
jgi:hypothetical protein